MKIFKDNGQYYFRNFSEILDELKPGNYTVKVNIYGEYYLEETPPYELPKKIYGNLEKEADEYLESFMRGGNMGILLNGEKGSGKTLLLRLICIKSGLPVIQIDTMYSGVAFFTFINNIRQRVVFTVDEFDKVYPASDIVDPDEPAKRLSPQLELLKLMDGGYESKKLFIFTSNELTVSEYMLNRPSRIRYKAEFDKVSDSLLEEVLEDKLENKKFKKDFLELNNMYFGFNLDTVLILIDEVNFKKKSPREVIRRMNIIPESAYYGAILKHGKKVYKSHMTISDNPLELDYFQEWWFRFDSGEEKIPKFDLSPSDYKVQVTQEGIIFEHPKGYSLTFKKFLKNKAVF